MTPGSAKSLLPEVVRRLGRLEVRARYIVEGLMSGLHRSPYFGQSVEFREHRQYAVGDELRHVDWKVWGRQDRLYVKRYEEDTNLRATLVVDHSASMNYGSGALTKREYADTAAAALAYLLLRQNDSVGCMVFDEGVRHEVPQRNQRNHLGLITRALESQAGGTKTYLRDVLARVAQANPRRGLILLVSDLLSDPADLEEGLAALRRIGHDIVVLHVLDDDELDFGFRGPLRFEGLEESSRVDCNPRALRRGYLEAMERYLHRVRRACSASAADYRLVRTSDPLDAALMSIVMERLLAQRSKV
jgi:uncharacterized protein (DUF58 family)